MKNRQDTNHLFELLKKTRDQLEILKGQETKAEEMRKQIHAAIRAEKAAAAEEQLQKTKGECANLKKESRELEEKLKQQAKDLESAGALYQEREALSKKRRAEDPGTDPQDPGNTSEIETGSQSEGTVSKVRTGYAGLYEKMSGNLTEI